MPPLLPECRHQPSHVPPSLLPHPLQLALLQEENQDLATRLQAAVAEQQAAVAGQQASVAEQQAAAAAVAALTTTAVAAASAGTQTEQLSHGAGCTQTEHRSQGVGCTQTELPPHRAGCTQTDQCLDPPGSTNVAMDPSESTSAQDPRGSNLPAGTLLPPQCDSQRVQWQQEHKRGPLRAVLSLASKLLLLGGAAAGGVAVSHTKAGRELVEGLNARFSGCVWGDWGEGGGSGVAGTRLMENVE